MKETTHRIYRLLQSSRFFRITVALFVFEATWIALSATYPQAFDENFHFGLIQLYSHYWLPFLSSQPPHANAYGAVARDPSYLYHYLMSFPYRLIALFIHTQITQIILLRLINIGLFSTGLVLLRRILLRVGISRPLAHASMFLFVLIPIVPQLAAQINYDNLLIPLIALAILLTFDASDQLHDRKPSVKTLIGLVSLCFFTSLVKYAFLPIFFGVVLFLLVIGLRAYRHRFKQLFQDLLASWRQQSTRMKLFLGVILVLGAGMFAQRDIVNLVQYHTLTPDCAAVLSVKACSSYSVWDYSYLTHQTLVSNIKTSGVSFMNLPSYIVRWVYWMWYRMFFAVNGPASSYTNYPPLPLPSAAAIIVTLIGALALIKSWRRVFRNNRYLALLFLVSSMYILALVVQGYTSYRYTDMLLNMNGRYLLPVLIFLAAIVGRAISIELRNAAARKVVLVSLMLVLFLQGGGLLTFIARSDDSWDLQNHAVMKVNDEARRITNPVLVDGKKNYTSRVWFFN